MRICKNIKKIISWFNTKFSTPGQPNNGNSINNKNNITTVLLETFRKDVIFFLLGVHVITKQVLDLTLK